MPLPVIWIIKAVLPFNQCAWDNLASWERRCRYLNQRLYLFPHKTVGGNLSLAKTDATRQEQLDLLAQLNIDKFDRSLSTSIIGRRATASSIGKGIDQST